MFVTVQFPMADLRPFLEETGRLSSPPWPLAEPARHFVRSLGGVRKRRRGGLIEWIGEDVYCDVRSGIALNLTPDDFRQAGLRPLWRRYFATGGFRWPGVVTRMEVGFAARIPRSLPIGMLSVAARNMAELSINVPTSVAPEPRPAPLGACGPRMARLLLAATTSHSAPPSQNWWLRAGRPIALAEIPAGRGKGTATLAVQELHTLGVNGVDLPLWVLRYAPGTDRGELRRLRIHLWRIHQEREVLRIVLASCIQGLLDPATNPRLRDYLAEQSKRLGKASTEGFPQRELLNNAYQLDALVEPDELVKLRSILAELGPGLMHSVVSVAGPNAVRKAHTTNVIVYQSGGRMVVHEGSGQHVDVGGGTVGNIIGGDVDNSTLHGVQSVTDAWKTFTAGTDLKQLAEELAVLRVSLKQQAVTPEHDIVVAEVARAEVAAAADKPEEARSALGKAGTWAFGVATSIGAAVAAGAIKAATGL
ncbi:hypothetical protein [Actinoplanes sp. M2I2]|uniref:hypothetical protein n=1 Tax=Actinoplanes sp. M2I2 TaxID=1734444 RepID=UPI0020226020|nr:hypothetical protein [Actinoplanes sp. M2I2]